MERTKGNLKVGDVVLLADKNFPRGQWPLARVIEVFPSEDGLVRSARVKTSSTVMTRMKRQRQREMTMTVTTLLRPITKLCCRVLSYLESSGDSVIALASSTLMLLMYLRSIPKLQLTQTLIWLYWPTMGMAFDICNMPWTGVDPYGRWYN